MTAQFFPSLLSANFAAMGQDIQAMEMGGANGFHVDVMDGHFVPNLTMGPDMMRWARTYSTLPFDVHLMVMYPNLFVPRFMEAGADRISFHVEIDTDILALLNMIKGAGKKAGLAVRPETSISTLMPYLSTVDYILLMTVSPGFSGGSFVPAAMEKITALNNLRHGEGLAFKIEVDGAMDQEKAPIAVAQGADWIVSGSGLLGDGIEHFSVRLHQMQQACRNIQK